MTYYCRTEYTHDLKAGYLIPDHRLPARACERSEPLWGGVDFLKTCLVAVVNYVASICGLLTYWRNSPHCVCVIEKIRGDCLLLVTAVWWRWDG